MVEPALTVKRTTNNRFYIVQSLLEELVVFFAIAVTTYLYGVIGKQKIRKISK